MSDHFDEEPDGDPHGECALEINRLKAECERLRAALEEFVNIVGESAEFEAAMLEPDGNFAEFVNKQQARVDSAVANASALLDAARGKP